MPDELDPAAFYFWWIVDELTGKRRKTSWRMTAETAKTYPGAEPDLRSKELRSDLGSTADIGRRHARD